MGSVNEEVVTARQPNVEPALHEGAAAGIREKLPTRVCVGWGAGEWAGSTAWAVFGTFFLFFMTDIVGLAAGLAGTVVLIVTIVAGVITPPLGVWSDSVKWKSGRRRPFLLIAAVPLAATLWLMFTDWRFGTTGQFVYFTVAGCFWALFYAMQQVPLTALAAEMTLDYNERTRLVSYRTAWSNAAYIVTTAAPVPLAGWFATKTDSDAWGWSLMMLVLAAACVPAVLWAWAATKGRELHPEKTSAGLKPMWLAMRTNRSFRYATGSFVGAYAAFGVFVAIIMYFMYYIVEFSDALVSVAFIALNGTALVATPVVERISERIGKRASMVIFMSIWSIAAILMLLVGSPSQSWLFWVLLVIIGPCLAAAVIGTWGFIPDCTEIDEYKTGDRREGLYYSVVTLAQMLATALAVWIVGLILGAAGYDPDAEQLSSGALWAIRLIIALGTAGFTIFTAITAWLQPVTGEKHAALCEALERRRRGEPVINEDKFADLL